MEDKRTQVKSTLDAVQNDVATFIEFRGKCIECAKMLKQSVSESYDGRCLDTSFIDGVIEAYGLNCVEFVIAAVITRHSLDGRVRGSNKTWAEDVFTTELASIGNLTTCVLEGVHIGLIDMLATEVQKREAV